MIANANSKLTQRIMRIPPSKQSHDSQRRWKSRALIKIEESGTSVQNGSADATIAQRSGRLTRRA
jgi:hypothetical protein